MSILKKISLIACAALALSCSKSKTTYAPAVASAQSRGVVVCYEEGFWGSLESLKVYAPGIETEVDFTPSIIKLDGVESCCLRLSVPLPDMKQMTPGEDPSTMTGSVDVNFTSDAMNLTLTFGFFYHVRTDVPQPFYGGSSIVVSSVSYGASTVQREGNTVNDRLVFDVASLINSQLN